MSDRPRGRGAATEALIDAARELFAERGPAAVSLRDVARRAGVNHGLIHHYIGSRDDLLRLVFDTSTVHARKQIEGAVDAGDALRILRAVGGESDEYTRLLAWALLEGHDPAAFHGQSAALDAIAGESREVRIGLAVAMVQALGWKLFGHYAVTAAGLSTKEAQEAHAASKALANGLVA